MVKRFENACLIKTINEYTSWDGKIRLALLRATISIIETPDELRVGSEYSHAVLAL